MRRNREGLSSPHGVELFAFGPNQALSYKFIAPKTGGGGFGITMATNATWAPMFMTVSETPCDFDIKKLLASSDRGPNFPRAIPNACYGYAPGDGAGMNVMAAGQATPTGMFNPAICFITPGKTYYFNIRSLSLSPARDGCAEAAKTSDLNFKCGGHLTISWAEEAAGKNK